MTSSSPAPSPLDVSELRRAAGGERAALDHVSAQLRHHPDLPLPAARELSVDDTAHLLLRLPSRPARALLLNVTDEVAISALLRMESSMRATLIKVELRERVSSLLPGLDFATAADVLSGMPRDRVTKILAGNPDAARLNRATDYPDDTVGTIMRRRSLLTAEPAWPAERVVERLMAPDDDPATAPAVFVVDSDGHLIGHLDLRDLAARAPGASVADLARSDVVAVRDTTDQEVALQLAEQHRLAELPVVDVDNRAIGVVSGIDLRTIAREEASEDIMSLSSAAVDADPSDTPLRILRSRFPWLVSPLIGATAAGFIIGAFEEALEQAVILAALIPLVMDMAGNAGIQSSSVTISALANPLFWRGDTRARLWREFLGSLLNGAAVAAVTAAAILVIGTVTDLEEPAWLAFTAALTLIAIIVQAAIVGVVVPLILHRLKLNPAAGTGVFITTINDFVGIAVLFLFATLFYLPRIAG